MPDLLRRRVTEPVSVASLMRREVPSDVAIVQKVCDYIEENFESKVTLSKLSDVAGLSQFHLHRNFKKITGVAPHQYLEAVRVRRAKVALKNGDSIRTSTYKAGHSSASWLYSGVRSKLGMPPSDYKSGGDGLSISYTLADSTLGRVLVAATEKGVCFVCLGDNDEKLVAYLQNEYPNARITPQSTGRFNAWISEILKVLGGEKSPRRSGSASRRDGNRVSNESLEGAAKYSVWKDSILQRGR